MPVLDPGWMAQATGGSWSYLPERVTAGVSTDTRTLQPGMLYVALRGEHFDGHVFLDGAENAGAVAAMVEGGGAAGMAVSLPLLRVADTRRALAALAHAYRAGSDACIIGITGSAGKSSVKEMTAAVLGAAGETACTRGNWNNDIGLPLSLLMMETTARHGVFEVGMNHPGEIGALCEILRPMWGCVTTIGPVHLEYFDSVNAIAEEKGALLASLPADGKAFLCRDDAYYESLRAMTSAEVRTLSLAGAAADLQVVPDAVGPRLVVREPASGESCEFAWPWPGRYNALNAGLALLIGRSAGLDWATLQRGLGTYRPLPMRWETCQIGPWQVINDAYNANPASMRAAIGTFAGQAGAHGKWLVLGDMLELGETAADVHEGLGAEVAEAGDWAGVVTVGPLAAHIADGAVRSGFPAARLWRCANAGTAVQVLRSALQEGDAVFVKASRGMKLENVVIGLEDKEAE